MDEIPKDPVNFLREDVEGDGSNESKPQQQQQHNKNRRYPKKSNNSPGEKTEGQGNSRPHNPKPRPQRSQNPQSQESEGSPRKTHPQALRTEKRTLATEVNNTAAKEASEATPHANRPRRPIQKQQQRPNKDSNIERNNLDKDSFFEEKLTRD